MAPRGRGAGRSTAVRAPVGDLPVVAVFLHRDFGNHAAVRFVVIPFRKPTRLPQPAFPHEELQLAPPVRTQETAWNRRIQPFVPKGAECARLEPVVRESGGEFGEGLPSLELGMEPLPRFAVLSQVAKDGNGLPFLERASPVDDRLAVKAERERQKEEDRHNKEREDVSPDAMVGRSGFLRDFRGLRAIIRLRLACARDEAGEQVADGAAAGEGIFGNRAEVVGQGTKRLLESEVREQEDHGGKGIFREKRAQSVPFAAALDAPLAEGGQEGIARAPVDAEFQSKPQLPPRGGGRAGVGAEEREVVERAVPVAVAGRVRERRDFARRGRGRSFSCRGVYQKRRDGTTPPRAARSAAPRGRDWSGRGSRGRFNSTVDKTCAIVRSVSVVSIKITHGEIDSASSADSAWGFGSAFSA